MLTARLLLLHDQIVRVVLSGVTAGALLLVSRNSNVVLALEAVGVVGGCAATTVVTEEWTLGGHAGGLVSRSGVGAHA